MPKIVDHDARRAEIARAVLRVVAREGVRGVTLRLVAEEAGWSTGVINHYFGDKKGMLLGAIREAALGVGDRMTSTLQIDDADARLRSLLEAGMPLDAERAAMCRIFFYFWAEGIVDAELGAELADYYAWWRTQVRAAVEEAQARGRFASFDAGDLSESLVALADGLGVQNMFDEVTMNAERLHGHIALIIDRLDPRTDCRMRRRMADGRSAYAELEQAVHAAYRLTTPASREWFERASRALVWLGS